MTLQGEWNRFGGTNVALWFPGDDPCGPLVMVLDTDPGETGAPHSHPSDQLRMVVAGSQRIGRRWYSPGDVRVQQADVVYGPELAGEEGSRQLLVFADRRGLAQRFVDPAEAPVVDEHAQAFVARLAPYCSPATERPFCTGIDNDLGRVPRAGHMDLAFQPSRWRLGDSVVVELVDVPPSSPVPAVGCTVVVEGSCVQDGTVRVVGDVRIDSGTTPTRSGPTGCRLMAVDVAGTATA